MGMGAPDLEVSLPGIEFYNTELGRGFEMLAVSPSRGDHVALDWKLGGRGSSMFLSTTTWSVSSIYNGLVGTGGGAVDNGLKAVNPGCWSLNLVHFLKIFPHLLIALRTISID